MRPRGLRRIISCVSSAGYPDHLITIEPLAQLVPSSVCLSCDVCCRFPEQDSFLRPYFTGREIQAAVARGIDPASFPDPCGSQVSVVPNPQGEGYLCPAFDPSTRHCRIYETRPLDCRLYPLGLMWNAAQDQVVLGWDTKCPYMQEVGPAAIIAHVDRVMPWLEQEETIETLAANPRLIGRFQEDVTVVRNLPHLTERVIGGKQFSCSAGTAGIPDPLRLGLDGLKPLTIAEAARMNRAIDQSGLREAGGLAAYSFPYHYIWRGILAYHWAEIGGYFCLFADSPAGVFMALPPLGPQPAEAPLDPLFEFMRRRNGASAVCRIENVPERIKAEWQNRGYRLNTKDPEYLYRVDDLVELAGDRYKSQRAACNRFRREHQAPFEPYSRLFHRDCLALLIEWGEQKKAGGLEELGRLLLEDAESAHRIALNEFDGLELVGGVVRIDGRVRAYTFGVWLDRTTLCILLEVADRTVPGLAQHLFRESCRMAQRLGATWINTMDDSGLSTLRASKQAYHPVRLVPSYVASPARL